MTHEKDHHEHDHHQHDHVERDHHDHGHGDGKTGSGVSFSYEGSDYSVPLEAARNAGLVGATDRIQLPDGQLVLLHPHAHGDNANTVQSIQEKGGKVWPVD